VGAKGGVMPDIVKLIFKDNYVQLELDNSEKLKISFDAYSMYKISSGTTLTTECYMELYEESRKFECMEKAFSQLAVRGRSVEELRQYLKKKNFSEKHIEDTLDYLKEKGYLNDYDYSMSFVKDKLKSGKSGKDIIVRDLYRKGVGRKIIDKVIRESGADVTDEDALYELATKKYRSVKDKGNSFIKVSNFLRGRGFDYESINRVLRRIKNDFEEE
jgi:regulatory protein